MKTRELKTMLVMAAVTLFGTVSQAEPVGINFFHGTWQEALAEAKSQNKPIFVDFYADWCGPCKWMAKEVFPDAEVGKFFNENFISLQINAEKQEADLVKQIGLEAYPTLALFDLNGKVISKQEGALESAKLIAFAKANTSFGKVYEEYKNDPFNFEKINAYLTLQEFQDKNKLDSIATGILNTLSPDQLKTQEAWNLLVKYSGDFNSPAFNFITHNASWYFNNMNAEGSDFQSGYTWFINAMLAKAAETKDKSLVAKAGNDFITMRKSCGTLNKSEAYFKDAIQVLYLQLAEDSTFQSMVVSFINTYHRNDWKNLAANALFILENGPINETVKKDCIRMAEKAYSLNNNSFTNWTLAMARQNEQKNEEAKKFSLAALQKSPVGSFQVNSEGSLSITFDEIGETVMSIPTKVK